jgi:hypothetical protein
MGHESMYLHQFGISRTIEGDGSHDRRLLDIKKVLVLFPYTPWALHSDVTHIVRHV